MDQKKADKKVKETETSKDEDTFATEGKVTKKETSVEEKLADIPNEYQALLKELENDPKVMKIIAEFDKQVRSFSLKEIIESNKMLKEELLQVSQERDEYLSLLQRYKADFENYKKRMAKQSEQGIQLSSERILSRIFEPIEDLGRAVNFANDSHQETIPLEGITIVHNKLRRILEDEGVEEINPSVGEPFNPKYHEAISIDPTGKYEPEKVVQLFEKGFKIKDKVIRAAKVMVSAEKPKESKKEKETQEKSENEEK